MRENSQEILLLSCATDVSKVNDASRILGSGGFRLQSVSG